MAASRWWRGCWRRARIRMLPLLSGETPLMAASRAGKPLVVEQLLKKGASTNARGDPRSDGADVGRRAEARGCRQSAARSGGADVHARTEAWEQMMAVPPHGLPEYNRMIPQGGDTALMFASRVGDLESASASDRRRCQRQRSGRLGCQRDDAGGVRRAW